ncbi:MAG: hypothetical protein HXY49_09045 [Ignavibacteriaceae bacterium]|nr:hypothetical protein [Ignavibacteriaceae bacterium]
MKKIFFAFLLIIVFNKTLFPQDELKEQFQFANKLYEQGKYFDAITEFKRLQFFDEKREYEFISNFLIGKCYKEGAKLSDAIFYFSKAEIGAASSQQIFDSRIEVIKSNILRKTISRALKMIDELKADERFFRKKDTLIYWSGWAYIINGEWDKAAEQFSQVSFANSLADLCDSIDSESYSVLFAKYISYIIPGAGQFYTGNFLSGLLSLGWNVLWGYTTVNAFIEERIFDGFAVANFLWLRFYSGNIQNAEQFALIKNLEISNKALDYLQYQFSGLKP